MKKTLLFALSMTAAIVLPQQQSFAAVQTIQVGTGNGFAFSPSSGVTIHVGDTINFVWVAGTHTTTSTTIPPNAATWNSPINSTAGQTSFMYIPTVAGTYNYQCNFHVSMGMVGSFVVTAPAGVHNVVGTEPITVSPNPASSSIKVHVADKNATFSLYDMAGRMVTVMQPTNRTATDAYFNIGMVATGMYMLKIQSGDNETMEKIEITR